MLIFSKRKILFISTIIVFSIFVSSFNKTLYVNSMPVTNHTIILDAGHGLPDGGAIGIDGSVESELNLKICLKLQNLLEASNCSVILTRSNENGIFEFESDSIRKKKISDMKKRLEISETNSADMFVSIHMNKINDSRYYGWQTFYKNDDSISQSVADNIQNNLNSYIDIPNHRSIRPIDDIYLAQNIQIPFILIECGFLSNEKENKLLQDNSYQNKIAWSIYSGIMDYFNSIN